MKAAMILILLERYWEWRTRREIAACLSAAPEARVPPLAATWARLSNDAHARRFYVEHFETEIEISRAFAIGAAATMALVGRVPIAVAAIPLSKWIAKQAFNEIEASLPVLGRLAWLREMEVVAGVGAASAASVDRLAALCVPRAIRGSIRAALPRPEARESHARRCRSARRKLAFRLLAGLVGGAVVIRVARAIAAPA
jgi:hypothetical protein